MKKLFLILPVMAGILSARADSEPLIFLQHYYNVYLPPSTNSNVMFGGLNATPNEANTAQRENTGIGNYALSLSRGCAENTAVGTGALYYTANGSYNTAVGVRSIFLSTTNGYNSALGYNSLFQATGMSNIALGYDAGYNQTAGNNNIYVGNTGAASDNRMIYIGAPGVQTNAYIAGVINGNGAGLTNLNAANVTGANTLPASVLPATVAMLDGNQTFSGVNTFSTVHVSRNIAAQAFLAYSDERIKRIQGRSDSARDLSTLMGIEVTDYSYIDTVAKGMGGQKKVIAQQVEKVYPQAVSQSTDAVPDIYEKATVRNGWVRLATTLKAGERVRLIGEKEKGVYEVLEVRDGAFRTGFKPATGDVFVYGREVKDFRSVDYDAISMLNVSATQELTRRVAALEKDNETLRLEIAEQKERTTRMQAEFDCLRKSIALVAAEK